MKAICRCGIGEVERRMAPEAPTVSPPSPRNPATTVTVCDGEALGRLTRYPPRHRLSPRWVTRHECPPAMDQHLRWLLLVQRQWPTRFYEESHAARISVVSRLFGNRLAVEHEQFFQRPDVISETCRHGRRTLLPVASLRLAATHPSS